MHSLAIPAAVAPTADQELQRAGVTPARLRIAHHFRCAKVSGHARKTGRPPRPLSDTCAALALEPGECLGNRPTGEAAALRRRGIVARDALRFCDGSSD